MDKYAYLFKSFNDRAYTKKAYLLSTLSIVNQGQEDKLSDVPYAALRDWTNNAIYFIDPQTKEKIIIEGVTADKPLFVKNEPLSIKASECRFVKEDIPNTTFGRFLFNTVVFYESLQNRVPYLNRQIEARDIENIVVDLMVDNPLPGEEVAPGKASVDDCLKITQQLDYLEGLNPVLVKASSLDVFSIDPDIVKLRDKLLKELEDNGKLNDPAEVTRVINTLVEEDAKRVLNGPSRDLYIKSDFISNSRRKMFSIFELSVDFHDGKYKLLRKSLAEGWDMNNFTEYTNSAINGSYSRSINVAKGGSEVKVMLLLTSSINVVENDCRSRRGENVFISKNNFNHWVGGFYLDESNKPVIIEKGDLNKLKGKMVRMRAPQFCKTPDGNLCKVCCGTGLGSIANRVASEVAGIMTSYMLLSMKAVHNASVKTKTFSIEEIIK